MKNNNCGATFQVANQLGRQVSRNAARRLPGKAGLSNLPYIAAPLSLLRLRRRVLLSAAAILTLLLSTATSSFAGSATWLASPATGNWNTAGNWTAGGPPDGSADTATFATSTKTGISSSASLEVNGIVFNAGASAFTISASGGAL